MSKKHIIVSILLIAYTIVLGHNAIPHGHFDDLFTIEHQQDSHHDSDHEHNYPFSHSVTLHVTIEKQTTFTSHSIKSTNKKAPLTDFLCVKVTFKPIVLYSFPFRQYHCGIQRVIQTTSNLFSNRAPPSFVV